MSNPERVHRSTRPRTRAAGAGRWARRLVFGLLLGSSLSVVGNRAEERDREIAEAVDNIIILPVPIPDPIEPVNRGLWAVNKGLMIGFVKPTAKGYRWIVPKPLRTGIRNAGRNASFPKKVINNLLQERWSGARDETYRFLCNSVFGVGGLFDVSTRWGIPESDADFGQTFGTWGWQPHIFLMLPLAGPSNERDAVGAVADSLVNPLTYFPPYSYITYGITYNNLAESADAYVRAIKTDFDPYWVLRDAWTLKRQGSSVPLTFEGQQHAPSLETLRAVFFSFEKPSFPESGDNRVVPIGTTGRKMPFTCWVQPKKAPLVYVVPGLGSHRLNGGALALAELLYNDGFSVVTVSSAYNYEFIEQTSSAAMPGYTPVDANDLAEGLAAIDQVLVKNHSDRLGRRALMGYSMGGFHTLYLAGNEQQNAPVEFDRYVALDTPVRLDYGIAQLDQFFRAALAWPPETRTKQIERTLLKAAALAESLGQLQEGGTIPFNADESKFLIGLAFRLSLRNIIFLSQTRTNQGVLQHPIDTWRREPVYREILQYSFGDYVSKFLTPYYLSRGVDLRDPEAFAAAVNLRVYSRQLEANPKLRIIENENDILLAEEDLAWLRQSVPADRRTFFEHGGHLGNLSDPAVQKAILDTVADLKHR